LRRWEINSFWQTSCTTWEITISFWEITAQQWNISRKSLKITEEIGNKLQSANALNRMSLIYRIQGDFQEALKHVTSALILSEELNNKN
jgi:hypothetical protein